MARKRIPQANVIQDAGLFAGNSTSPSGSQAITTIESFNIPQESESQIATKLEALEREPGTRYSSIGGARSHLTKLMRS